MAKDIEMQIVERAYNNVVLHPPSPFLQWVSVIFIFLLFVVLLIALGSLYYIAKDIYKNIKHYKAKVVIHPQ
jgi:hypothetical protein